MKNNCFYFEFASKWPPAKAAEFVTFSDTTAGIGASFRTHARTHTRTDGWTEEGQTDVEVKIVI